MTLDESATAMGVSIPDEFLCPLTMEIIIHPLMTRYNNISYEREAIISWLRSGDGTCPMTRAPLNLSDLVPNKALEEKIYLWSWENMLPEPRILLRSSKYPVIGIVTSKDTKKDICNRIESLKIFNCQ